MVNTLPLVTRLRAGLPQARLVWVIGPRAYACVAGHPAVDRFLVLDLARPATWWRAVRELRQENLTHVLELHGLLKGALVARASGAPVRWGFDRARCRESSWLFHTHRLPSGQPQTEHSAHTAVAQNLEFAEALGLPAQPPRWDLPWEPAPVELVPPRTSGRPRIVLNHGASKPSNRWPVAAWTRLAQLLHANVGADLHITGGPEDAETAVALAAAAGVPCSVQAGRLSLRQTAGLLRSADLVISGDTGPLHMAVALRCPVVAIFGAADPARTGPYGEDDWVVTHRVPCSPCRKRECFVPGHPCLTQLAPERVFERALQRLASTPLMP